ncbi:Uncharacterised protein [uncultured archaeon]|nr:Uncharacterised protein [uncultured archaeon]
MRKVKIFVVFLFASVFLSGCISIPHLSSTALSPANIGTTPTSAPIVEGNAQAGVPGLGPGADMHGFLPFPQDNPWNKDISGLPVDPDSNLIISTIGIHPLHPDFGTVWNGAPNGIPYLVVSGSQPKVKVSFDYAEESDNVPYPIPPDAPIEGGPQSSGDRHILVIDRDARMLYELYAAYPDSDGSWKAGSGAVFNLTSNALRPARFTSADAAGLPIFPGLVRYDEVVSLKEIRHALRFTVPKTRKAFVCPARHYASTLTDAKYPPMGARFRLKASFDISGFPENEQVILRALEKYGMILADNGGAMFLSGAPDFRWNDEELGLLKKVKTTDFEVVNMPTPTGPEGEAQTC